MMLQGGTTSRPADAKEEGWTVYLRVAGDGLLDLADSVRRSTPLVRGPERMFYGLVEFEVVDPDGYRICVSGSVPADANVPELPLGTNRGVPSDGHENTAMYVYQAVPIDASPPPVMRKLIEL